MYLEFSTDKEVIIYKVLTSNRKDVADYLENEQLVWSGYFGRFEKSVFSSNLENYKIRFIIGTTEREYSSRTYKYLNGTITAGYDE